MKNFSILSHINIQYFLKPRTPIMHRQFFKKRSQSPEYNQTHCNDKRNPFRLACPRW